VQEVGPWPSLHCGSDALVRDGHAPNRKQKYHCHACGRRSRENPMPTRQIVVKRSCTRIKNEAAYVALPAHLGSRASPSPIGSKKGTQLPPFITTLVTPDPEDATATHSNWMNSGRLCSKKPIRVGSGLPYAARRGKWLPMRWVTGVNRRVCVYGSAFPQHTARGVALRISGEHTKQ
jgi:hypothetical protein